MSNNIAAAVAVAFVATATGVLVQAFSLTLRFFAILFILFVCCPCSSCCCSLIWLYLWFVPIPSVCPMLILQPLCSSYSVNVNPICFLINCNVFVITSVLSAYLVLSFFSQIIDCLFHHDHIVYKLVRINMDRICTINTVTQRYRVKCRNFIWTCFITMLSYSLH